MNYQVGHWNEDDLLAKPSQWEKETASNAVLFKQKSYGVIKLLSGAFACGSCVMAASNKEMVTLSLGAALVSGALSVASYVKETGLKKNFKKHAWCYILDRRIERGAG